MLCEGNHFHKILFYAEMSSTVLHKAPIRMGAYSASRQGGFKTSLLGVKHPWVKHQ
jgi:hypothetical protein